MNLFQDDLSGLKEDLSSESDGEFPPLPHPEGESSDSLENGKSFDLYFIILSKN